MAIAKKRSYLARRDNQLLSRTFGDLAAAGSQVEVIIALCSTLLLLAIVLKLPKRTNQREKRRNSEASGMHYMLRYRFWCCS